MSSVNTRQTRKYSFQQKLVEAVNNLVEKDELVAWSRIKEERREHTITKLLHSVEEGALTLAKKIRTPTELEIKATQMGEIIINTELVQTLRLHVIILPFILTCTQKVMSFFG